MKNLWNQISYLGLKTNKKTLENRAIILSNQINLLLFAVLTVLYFILMTKRILEDGTPTFGSTRVLLVALLCAINLLFSRYGYILVQKTILIFLPTFIIIVLSSLLGFVEEESFVYYPYVIIALSLIPQLILNSSQNKLLYFLSILYFVVLLLFVDKLLIINNPSQYKIVPIINEFYFMYKLLPVIIFLFINICVFYLRSINLQYSNELEDKNVQLQDTLDTLKLTQQHLVQSEKMASLGTLTAGIAHEINNPLNFISGGAELIKNMSPEIEKSLSEEDKETYNFAVENIIRGLDRTITIVSSLMKFSYRGTPILVKSDLSEIINNTLLFLKSKLGDSIVVQKNLTFNNSIFIYPDKLHQVVLNLLDNAIYAVKQKSGDEPKLIEIATKLTEQNNKEFAEIIIANNGPEIPDDKLRYIFDPFYTTKAPGKGTGLGLSISFSLIKDHNGSITAENNHGFVIFKILLPINVRQNENESV